MNETEMTALLERARTGLEPDVAALVAGGTARGRARRRRRRIGTAAAATTLVLAGTALVGVVTGAGGSGPVGPAGGSGPRAVVVPPEEMGATLAGLLPGATVREDTEDYLLGVRRGVVGWQGDVVTLTIDTRSAGTASSPEERCLAFMGGPECVALPDGSWTTQFAHFRLEARTGEALGEERVVRVWTTEGYLLEAGARELPAERLRALALDDVWLR